MPEIQLPYIPDLYDVDTDRFVESRGEESVVLTCWMWTMSVVEIEDQEGFQ